MSVPKTLEIPAGVDVVTLETSRGNFAAHVARPAVPAGRRGRKFVPRGHVLLIPGFTGSKEDFTPLLPLLAASGLHVTAYDQRGQYQSRGSEDDDYSLAGFALDALAVREASSMPHTHLVGHSFGGLVAQTATVESPGVWSSLTLLCTGPAGFTTSGQVEPLRAAIDMVDSMGLDALHTAREAEKQRQPAAEIAAFLRKRFTANNPESLKAIAGHLVSSPDRIDEIAALPLPKLVAHGADDDAWPHEVQAQMAHRLGVKVDVIPDAAHSPAIENTEATARLLLDFLR